MGEDSKVVSDGMKQVCSALTKMLRPLGFKRGNGRKWIREVEGFKETIFVSRSGASYGAPYSPSITLRLDLSSVRLSDGKSIILGNSVTQYIRRSTGYCYHHRFNAKTGSTYNRCVEELELFMAEVAEPWFFDQRHAARESETHFSDAFALRAFPARGCAAR